MSQIHGDLSPTHVAPRSPRSPSPAFFLPPPQASFVPVSHDIPAVDQYSFSWVLVGNSPASHSARRRRPGGRSRACLCQAPLSSLGRRRAHPRLCGSLNPHSSAVQPRSHVCFLGSCPAARAVVTSSWSVQRRNIWKTHFPRLSLQGDLPPPRPPNRGLLV